MEDIVYDQYLFGFSSRNATVYLKESTDYRGWYAVKIMHKDGTKTFVDTLPSLSAAMRSMAETVATFTDGFTTWKQIK